MDRRFATFLVLSALVLIVNMWVMRQVMPPQPKGAAGAAAQRQGDPNADPKAKKDAPKPKKGDDRPAKERKPDEIAPPPKPAQAKVPLEWRTLGSVDERSRYRMLVTFTNQGAAVERIELASERFRDLEDRSGYLGHLAADRTPSKTGCLVRVVGRGTPADGAGLRSGDTIQTANGKPVKGPADLEAALAGTKPGDVLKLGITRSGKPQNLTATLARRPLEVVRPEGTDQDSFLMTLEQLGKRHIEEDAAELPGVSMRTGNWRILPADPKRPDEVAFEWVMSQPAVKIIKRYSLAKLSPAAHGDPNAPAYHLQLQVEIENIADRQLNVAYRLDGPTGLPTEGWWYAKNSKINPTQWSSPGLRDVVVGFAGNGRFRHALVTCQNIVSGDAGIVWRDEPMVYMGIDAQYFSVVLIPQLQDSNEVHYSEARPILVGPKPDSAHAKIANVSCRLVSQTAKLAAGEQLRHRYTVFAGPKRPKLLAQYADPFGLGELVSYGWFWWVSKPMLAILHFFYSIVGNYGLAIIMLTVLVRSCMFPLSRKQALGAQKMQELQPEMKRLAEKHKGNVEARTKAQQELFRKHNYHPLAGCLPAFIQLPIFLGLYRSLAVDVELRQAPLLTEAIRWCSNLAAPDMLWFWYPYLPGFLASETGWLGPYLNVLPLVTVALFLWQQKMFMPPPADEQAAMQQKMMQYMMLFIGVMFFTVASGLCVYFIASSLWGIAERKLLPKAAVPQGKKPLAGTQPASSARSGASSPGGNGQSGGARKQERGRK